MTVNLLKSEFPGHGIMICLLSETVICPSMATTLVSSGVRDPTNCESMIYVNAKI